MKNRFGIILALIVLLGISVAVYWRIAPSSDAWHAASELKESRTFGFGAQGVDGGISEDETRYFLILDSPKSHLVFSHLYDTGTPEAKAFAVVGLRQTFLGRIDKRIDDFVRLSTPFHTLSGCIGGVSTPKDLLVALDSGYFQRYVSRLNNIKKAQAAAPNP